VCDKPEKKMFESRGSSIFIFMIFMGIIIWSRPKFLVDEETDNWKLFGIGDGKSCINITTIIIVSAIVIYLFSAFIGTSITKLKTKWKTQGGGVVSQGIDHIII